jgi:1-acyl-sn-glycerol-3-phosphate acyltransferase
MQHSKLREDLYRTAVQGVRFALHLPDAPWAVRLVEGLFGKFMANVIDVAVTFDQKVGEESLTTACKWISAICGEPAEVLGKEKIPAEGPVLVVSNHPGYFEGMLTISQMPREDIKIIVGGIPYFNQMPNTRQRIFYTDHSDTNNISALRNAVRHLKSGGMFLIYPTGQADPDPDAMPGSMERIDDWSDSVALMLRRVPETILVPTIVSGIVDPQYLRHPLARIQRERRSRIRVAELFQMYRQFIEVGTPPISRPRLSFGEPVSGSQLIDECAKELLKTHMSWVEDNGPVWA